MRALVGRYFGGPGRTLVEPEIMLEIVRALIHLHHFSVLNLKKCLLIVPQYISAMR